MSTDQSYEYTARFYDAAYEAASSTRLDAPFYEALAVMSGGPVLELGCGTGRVLLPIAARGVSCAGVDASPAMLDRLRGKAGASLVELVCGRMEVFDFGPRRFRLIFSAFRAFQHLDTVEQQLACLAQVRSYLEPGGLFTFDVFNARLERMAQESEPEALEQTFMHEGREIRRYVSVTRDRIRQLIRVTMRYVEENTGTQTKETVVNFSMRWFGRYELEHLMHRAGFKDVVMYGDFDSSPVGLNSPALIVLAR